MTNVAEEERKLRVAVLVSGSGTNLQSLLDHAREGLIHAEIVCVGSDRDDAFGLVRAERAGIATFKVSYERRGAESGDVPKDLLKEIDERQRIVFEKDPERRLTKLQRLIQAEMAIIEELESHGPELVCLAGFMRLLTPFFLDHFNTGGQLRIVNVHPALLPSFPGTDGYGDTFRYGCRWGGITVHFVDEGEDSGPIIAQAVYPIWKNDTEASIRCRGLRLEHRVYPKCVDWIARGQVVVRCNDGEARPRVSILDPAYPDVLRSWISLALEG